MCNILTPLNRKVPKLPVAVSDKFSAAIRYADLLDDGTYCVAVIYAILMTNGSAVTIYKTTCQMSMVAS